ncbi:uncharacterized protein EI90DRAFT_2996982 [Cantharellus anzutake]|uniref:uncharacterized protein n=1 Tax=Cantharellus anzutake TaxID=1750568 RepID=UPI001907422F|nr:uncharacterized protein EI90DRAFT_2996982 [Cantharellus anzutake]KAF8329805.1 hypothetical protein EI90DRAFT_2996982 [Cantharellus anzutake]
MNMFPSSLVSADRHSSQTDGELHTPEEDGGQITPSHGGLVQGHEFDLPISPSNRSTVPRDPSPLRQSEVVNGNTHTSAAARQSQQATLPTIPQSPPPPETPTTPQAPRPQPTQPRSRPISMPPQQAKFPNGTSTTESMNENRARAFHKDDGVIRSRASGKLLGMYTLTKTLGAGSMGKVKLAINNVNGEQLAVKIVSRKAAMVANNNNDPNDPPPTASFIKAASKEASKEIRTVREASLSMLLYHPYICGMREFIIHQNHYYMVFEYVNGGQMLDYIISHGRLRERVARKFARQIGSALEYCHLNNVVHRDLKIENILISQSGNIKIIDFGLSNLYDPLNHLSTFCGSLYFAAPELLNAKVYTGPEVDVWSFGVVLYVLVCGKVPFDDQSMPALHAKIKRGNVEYPVWLSAECKHLLMRMLVTNPNARATMQEVMSHPWMVRNFSGSPAVHMVQREPLRADELERDVIRGMTGFEFGTEDDIENRLTDILLSEQYRRAVDLWERKRDAQRSGKPWVYPESFSVSGTIAGSASGDSLTRADTDLSSATTKKSNKRFSGLEFYRKKFFSPSSPPAQPKGVSSSDSAQQPVFENKEPLDPTRGFHPLISIYYLVREKLERERVYGQGHFAGSGISLSDAEAIPSYASASAPSTLPTPPVTALSGLSTKLPLGGKPDYNMALPRLPAPETSHYSGMSYESPQSSPAPAQIAFAQPRAKTDAVGTSVSPHHPAPRDKENTDLPTALPSATLPRAPPASTHRRSQSLSQRPSMLRAWGAGLGFGGLPTQEEVPRTAGPEVQGFADRAQRKALKEEQQNSFSSSAENPVLPSSPRIEKKPSCETRSLGANTEPRPSTPESTASAGATLVRRFGSILGRDDKRNKRTSIIIPTSSPRSSFNQATSPEPKKGDVSPLKTVAMDIPHVKINEPDGIIRVPKAGTSQSQPASVGMHRRAATALDPTYSPSKSGVGGHHRRGSIGSVTRVLGGRSAKDRKVSGPADSRPHTASARPTASGGNTQIISGDKPSDTVTRVPVNGVGEHAEAPILLDGSTNSEATMEVKSVYLKGLFSVATTSTKPPTVLRGDIKRVLDRMQIQHREIKSGFECIHLPSIDLSSIQNGEAATSDLTVQTQATRPRTIARKVSRLSFGRKGKEKELPERPESVVTALEERAPSSSKLNEAGNVSDGASTNGQGAPLSSTRSTNSLDSQKLIAETFASPPTPSPHSQNSKSLPPVPRDHNATPTPSSNPAAPKQFNEVTFESTAKNVLCVRFEISIVKVPFLPLHGLQFRRIGGDAWQYQMLARRVLTELKL